MSTFNWEMNLKYRERRERKEKSWKCGLKCLLSHEKNALNQTNQLSSDWKGQ